MVLDSIHGHTFFNSNFDFVKIVIIYGDNNISSTLADNRKKIFLVLGEVPT